MFYYKGKYWEMIDYDANRESQLCQSFPEGTYLWMKLEDIRLCEKLYYGMEQVIR